MRSKWNRRPITALVGATALLLSGLAANTTIALTATPAAAASAPTSATDETKVPHYFGPSPNWANSPLTMATADVKIAGAGKGATAIAQVDPSTGGITKIDVTSPGHDYAADTTVTVEGAAGTPATASATVTTTGGVVAATVDNGGSGYAKFKVDVTGGGGTGASMTPSGGVDAVKLADGGSGYTMPTVSFDLPDDPNGTIATGHVEPADLTADGVVTQGHDRPPGLRLRDAAGRSHLQRHAVRPDLRQHAGPGQHHPAAHRPHGRPTPAPATPRRRSLTSPTRLGPAPVRRSPSRPTWARSRASPSTRRATAT